MTYVIRAASGTSGQRGPVEHERRAQILEAADAHFRQYGYAKTTVADLARSIGLSTAYIYKFFDSKQAIAEAICRQALGHTAEELRKIAQSPKPAATRLRLVYQTVAQHGAEIFFNDRKLHDLAVTACTAGWEPVREHRAFLLELIRSLITEGRSAGEFERKTPIAETSQAVMQTLDLFTQPLIIEHNSEDPVGRAESVANLVLRSLAP